MRCVLALALATSLGCGRWNFDELGGTGVDDDACVPGWSPPVHLDALASADNDWDAALSPDRRTIVFSRRPVDDFELYVATGDDMVFGAPVPIAALNTTGQDLNASWSPDGATLYFTRSGGASELRMYESTFDGTTFGAATQIGSLGTTEVLGAYVAADDRELVFTQKDPVDHLMRAVRSAPGDPWQSAAPIAELNVDRDGYPTLSPDRLEIIFDSWRTGTRELWQARRASIDLPFDAPTRIEELADPSSHTGDPELSRDGNVLVFASDRAGTTAQYDLWYATRGCF